MKKLIYSLAALAGMTAFSSCNDFLTEDVRGSENLETYFSTPDEVETAVGGCYFQIAKGGGWWQIYNSWLLSDMTTDDLWDGNTTQDDGYQEVTHFFPTTATSESYIMQNFWGARYQGINSCNLCLERIPDVKMDENLKRRRLAEVRFLRAFFYFDLVRNFGGVPMMTEYGTTGAGVERSSQEDCYKFIEDELKLAIPDLPERSQLAASELGRITKGAALGILGKAQLYQAKWSEAKTTLKTIIDSSEYHLLANFGDVWSVKHNNSEESLFEVQQMYSDTYATGGSLTVVTGCRNGVGDGWSWGQPTSDLENAFIAAGDTERLKWTIIKTMCTEIAGENQFSKFVSNNSNVCGVSDAKYKDYMDVFGWTAGDYYKGYIIDPAQHKSARIIRKYFVPLEDRPEVYNIDKIPLNHRVLRYADVLLMYAEACAETGDDGQGQWALNQVRNRVHLADVTSTGKALRDAIRAERRLELAHEQCRLYDLRRWDCDNGKKMMCNIMGPNGSFVKYNMGPDADMYEKWNQGEPSDKGIRFQEDRDLLYPIPYYEIVHSNGAIKQNPGW